MSRDRRDIFEAELIRLGVPAVYAPRLIELLDHLEDMHAADAAAVPWPDEPPPGWHAEPIPPGELEAD